MFLGMLAVPNLPTDNLYKFVALAGLTMVVLSLVLFAVAMNARWDTLDRLEVDQASLDAEITNLRSDLDVLAKQAHPSAGDLRALRQRQQDLVAHAAVMAAKAGILRRLREGLKELVLQMYVGAGLGGGIAAVGFMLWYRRVQVFQDQLLRAQAKEQVTS
jgi:hypothetical protein